MAYTVVSGHPRVDILASEVSALATRAAGTHSTEYGTLKAWCDSHIGDTIGSLSMLYLGWHMEAYGFVYLIEEELGNDGTTYSDRAKALMDAMVWDYSGIGNYDAKKAFARAFDWIYPELSSEEKAALK